MTDLEKLTIVHMFVLDILESDLPDRQKILAMEDLVADLRQYLETRRAL